MSEPKFTATNSATWPATLTVYMVAAIYPTRTVSGIRKKCQQRTFVPAPMLGPDGKPERPYAWRKVDVLRRVEGARGSSLRKVS